MKKLLSILAMLLIGFTACQKDSEITKPEDNNSSGGNPVIVNLNSIPPSITARIHIPTQPQTVMFKTRVSTNTVYEPMTVRITHWEYQNGRTPMIITGVTTMPIGRMPGVYLIHDIPTGFSYTGNMQVDIIQDSLNLVKYTRTVMLTDSLGWTVNWDTTANNQQGYVGQNRIVDVIPKHYQ